MNGTHESLSPVTDISYCGTDCCDSPSITECPYCFQTKLQGCECDEEEEEIDPNETTSGSDSEYVSEEEELYIPDPPSMQRQDSYLDPGVRRFSYRLD
jgi:hypothetical protein